MSKTNLELIETLQRLKGVAHTGRCNLYPLDGL